jgi:hypothetical protein
MHAYVTELKKLDIPFPIWLLDTSTAPAGW